MKMFIRKLILNQEGINTVEIVILVAIAIGLALIFRAQISNFLNSISLTPLILHALPCQL